ncbi:hypothetical protein A2W13_01575 [Candidatus Woesebacteria bacterium RBG_16_36_11]|uniref:Uncharacterized protein n=3 Tax=Candidatus Woeseibacteriota TaxID=1752722 RepID=A0A1F7XDB1_9BACT|nr:MAG: hypothetical protein A2Z67_03585 [Candidatus Woesebacteria bacterium RBG_13_36_22]OGM12315.1 MAG: hypothetical protein A2W13_01575 [Candidatus Woesebacteria bacterium RBG_16_36_11]OGM16268.1 MAG: hypothetical protein A2V55_02540 [Candidatus Woesebacteria bacterium RBG_19FT_COMBO_37_29]
MDNSFSSIIESANSILILLPTRPYFDQVAAGLSLYLALRNKKNVTISCPSQMLVEFNRLVGVNKITTELGNKNLVIKFSDYKATGIERVSYDIENGEFKLSVIPKPGNNPPTKEQVALSFSGVSADTIILIGGINDTHFPSLSSKELVGAKLVHLGIKALIAPAGMEVLSFARPAASVAELVYYLVKESSFEIDPDIATNLLLGIEAGTNNYSSSFVSADTFQMASDLMRLGGKRHSQGVKRQDYPEGAIPGELPPTQEGGETKEPPKDWLAPKIYKGTSVS